MPWYSEHCGKEKKLLDQTYAPWVYIPIYIYIHLCAQCLFQHVLVTFSFFFNDSKSSQYRAILMQSHQPFADSFFHNAVAVLNTDCVWGLGYIFFENVLVPFALDLIITVLPFLMLTFGVFRQFRWIFLKWSGAELTVFFFWRCFLPLFNSLKLYDNVMIFIVSPLHFCLSSNSI